ncbi:MAG: hypothetical protein NVS4B3_13960 [Gemmatimonadaceae bacterium]
MDALGWKTTSANGMRSRQGRPLRFSLTVPTSSESRRRYATLIQEQMRQLGVQVDVDLVDINTLIARMGGRSYDAILGAWSVDPSPWAIRQSWSARAAREKDGSNSGGYISPTFDALIDSASADFDPVRQRAFFSRAYRTVVEDVPAIFLYELRPVAAAHRRIRVTGMRGDAWWAGLPDWSILPAERLDRDRLGLGAAVR